MTNKKALKFIKKTNLNVVDIKILVLCFEKGYSVSGLQNTIGIAYKNLLPHVKKLESNGLIIIKDSGKGKKKEIRTNTDDIGVNYFMFGLIALWTPQDVLKKNKKLEEEIIKFLEQKH